MKRIFLKIGLFFGLFLLFGTIILSIPYSKKFAFHYIKGDCYNHGSWIYNRIVKNTVSIDIAFIGSSHTIHAFQEPIIEDELDGYYNVVNLGYCRYGRNLQYSILKELIRYKSPRIIVIEVHEDEEKNSHDIFPYIADKMDLLATPTLFNRDYFSDLMNGLSARIEALKAKYIFHFQYPSTDMRLHGFGESDRLADIELLEKNQLKWNARKNKAIPNYIRETQLKLPKAYLEKMIQIIRNHEIELLFVYLPEFGSQLDCPINEEYYTKHAPVLIPPSEILKNPSNWMDEGHLNNEGSKQLSTWIAHELKNIACTNTME